MNVHRVVLLVLLLLGPVRTGQACAVPTSIRVENQGVLPVRALHVTAPPGGANLLPAGLSPGQAATVTLPSCIGTYTVSATFADGRTVHHAGLNAMTIRGIELR